MTARSSANPRLGWSIGLSVLLSSVLLGLAAPRAHAADSPDAIADMIGRLRLQEAPAPVRERKGWRVPHKIVVLAFRRPGSGQGSSIPESEWRTFGPMIPQARLVAADDEAAAIAAASDADILIGYNPEICDRKIIEAAKSLRWILSLAAGVENCMKLDSVHQRDLLVTNMRGIDSAVIAEHAIALALALAHGLDVFAADTARAQWRPGTQPKMEALSGKTLLVVGLGGIGTEVARRAHGLGMNVIATRGSGTGGPDFVSHVGTPNDLLTLAKSADVIVNSTPLTPQTTHLFDDKFFAVVKPSAYFINVARGQSADTAALVRALNENRLAGAGLDVVDPEPLPPDHPLWRAPHVLITPHTSSGSDLPEKERWMLVRENLRRYAAGEKMLSVVDLQRQY
jgi:phosphoglycerate dehydrogenase-like enzyme